MKTKPLMLLGLPGVRVQEHATLLAERWQIPQISLAKLLPTAQLVAIGGTAQTSEAVAAPLPDTEVLKILRRRLEQPDAMLQGWVLEGFPTTVAQAQGFDEWWTQLGHPPVAVVYLKAMTGILMNRLTSEPGQPASTEVIRRHLEHHQAALEPLLAYYQQRQQLQTINGSLSFAEVARDLAALGQSPSGAAPFIQHEAELDRLITQESRLVVNCTASWCGSCKQVSPSIDKLAEAYGDRVKVMKIDFDTHRQISKRFGLQGLPAVMLFKEGKLQQILTGIKAYPEYVAAVTHLLA
jgi:adenylate kinase family enzyme